MKIKTTIDPTDRSLSLALLDQQVAGTFADKRIAYSMVTLDEGGFGLGIAVEYEAGYYPVPKEVFSTDNLDEVNEVADGMNLHIGLDLREAAIIVASSMRRQ